MLIIKVLMTHNNQNKRGNKIMLVQKISCSNNVFGKRLEDYSMRCTNIKIAEELRIV